MNKVESLTGTPFQDYAGSVVVHAISASNIPFLALGSWILCVGWFGFNVMSAQSLGETGNVSFLSQLIVTIACIVFALSASFIVYGILKK